MVSGAMKNWAVQYLVTTFNMQLACDNIITGFLLHLIFDCGSELISLIKVYYLVELYSGVPI